jgi:hypothetical protein
MLEYIFFAKEPCERFVSFLSARSVSVAREHNDEGYLVRVPETLDDACLDEIEACYDELMDLDQLLMEQGGDDSAHKAGITVNLADGRTVYACIAPELLNKVLRAVTPEELGELVDAIVDAVENPDQRSLCGR